MAARKEQYPLQQVTFAKYAKALSHPARLMILKFLEITETCTFGTLSAILPISKASTAQHLTVLKSAKLVNCKSVPPHMYYSLNTKALVQAKEISDMFFSPITPNDFSLATQYLSKNAVDFMGQMDEWIDTERSHVEKHLTTLQQRGLIDSNVAISSLSNSELKTFVKTVLGN